MNFASDNAAGIAPEILAALGTTNGGYAIGYGDDDVTRRLEGELGKLFEHDVAAFLVPTGTAANALALAHLSPPWGAVFCHRQAHIVTSEAGAPEFFGGGLKLIEIAGDNGMVSPAGLREALENAEWGGPHHVTPSVLSLTQVTEAGTIYPIATLRELATIAHGHGMAVHMDGARFGNAIAALGVSPAEASWKSGVDVLSFGATKGGAAAAEAIIFFNKDHAKGMAERRKRGGALVSKHRFIAVQFEAFLADGLWLKLARRANAMATRLARGLETAAITPVWPVEANLVFAVLPADIHKRLSAAGARYYARSVGALPKDMVVADGAVLARMVTSFSTTEADVDSFLAIAGTR
jgi:threonine aldolase